MAGTVYRLHDYFADVGVCGLFYRNGDRGVCEIPVVSWRCLYPLAGLAYLAKR